MQISKIKASKVDLLANFKKNKKRKDFRVVFSDDFE
jgi:hypothetical protein